MMARLALEGRNELLERYFSKYRSFLKKHEAWALAFQTMYDVGFRLVNGGTGPATNVDVKIVFPSHIKILKTTSFPMEPDEPAAPSQADVDVPYAPMHERLFNQPFLPDISPHYDGCPSFEEGGRALEYDAATVKHGCDLVCDAVLFQVPLDRFDPFELNVSITYNEGDRVEHKLAVTFD
ncbi:MAG: hypothetical protein QOG13_2650 [Sphingomonadales bacterium]|nr:hypothetical protein [Sphingomonadales bacterium]